VVGLAIVVIGAVTSSKLRRRDDIAAVLGAPVKMSITTSGIGKRAGGRRQGDDVKRVIGYLRSVLHGGSRRPVSLGIVAVDNARDVASLVVALIASLAEDRNRVAVADLADGVLAGQLGVEEAGTRMAKAGGADVAVILPDRDGELAIGPLRKGTPEGSAQNAIAAAYSGCDVFVTLATLDPSLGGDYLATWANQVVVVVTAGESSAIKVQSMGEMVRFAGAHLTGAVLLGADKDDESLGIAFG
jgi:hypothetical protein